MTSCCRCKTRSSPGKAIWRPFLQRVSPSLTPAVCSAPQVVWPACFRFVPCHEAHVLWECDVGHLLLQQAEGWSCLQSVFPCCPQSRFEHFRKKSKHLHCWMNGPVLTCPTSSPAGCGGSISSWNGSISSPHYPSFYPPNVDCLWTVKVSHVTGHGHADNPIACLAFGALHRHLPLFYQAPLPGYLLSVTIVTMDIQDSVPSDGCERDWLDIGGVK